MTHPKVVGLSDKAFRLWVWGLSYSQQHLTDGLLVQAAIPSRLARAKDDLIRVQLWDRHIAGFLIHDYLDWNDSRDTVLKKRDGLKTRVNNFRRRDDCNALQSPPSWDVTDRSTTSGVGNSGSGSSEKERDDFGDRAGRLREELYPRWYAQHRHGARLRLMANALEFQEALLLVQTWDDSRLEKLAKIVLTTDDPWISRTDRGFKIFALKASWAEDRLVQWEREHGVSV